MLASSAAAFLRLSGFFLRGECRVRDAVIADDFEIEMAAHDASHAKKLADVRGDVA